jgi:hypothetical protein
LIRTVWVWKREKGEERISVPDLGETRRSRREIPTISEWQKSQLSLDA